MSERTPKQRHARRLETLQRRADFLQERIEAEPNRDLNFDKAERSAVLWAIAAINENERLRDLVRYCRHQLHEENLITDEEFAALVEVGSESARRLENYDAMLAQIEELHAELKTLKT
jgi:hypothetical protein